MAVPIIGKRREKRQAALDASVEKALSPMLAQVAAQSQASSGATYAVNPSSPFNQVGPGQGFVPLPRPEGMFDSGFGPGYPLFPDAIDPVGANGRTLTRRTQYLISTNINLIDRRIPWSVLKGLAEDVDVIQRCIQIVQDALIGLDWSWGFSPQIITQIMNEQDLTNSAKATAIAREKFGDELDRVQQFFEYPDKKMGFTFDTWLTDIIASHLTFDGVVISPSYNLGGELTSLSTIDTSTIKILLDNQGFIPQPPAPAYQQILYGFARGEYQAEDMTTDGKIPNGYTDDQLAYYIRRPHASNLYGYSQVEECINIATIYMERQAWLHAEYCYDDQTEVLTDKGWQYFKNLDGTERVASRGIGGEFVWERPTDYIVNNGPDELVEFKNSKIDLLVTPNHRMLLGIVDGGCRGHLTDEFVMRADETAALVRRKRQKLGIPTTSTWTGTPVAEKIIESSGKRRGYRMDMRVWCEFLGLFIAEGNTAIQRDATRQRNDVVISQSTSSDRMPEIRRILAATPFRWMEQNRTNGMTAFTVSSAQLADELVQLGHSWEKRVPADVKNLPVDCLEALLHGFWVGDGFVKRSRNSGYEAIGYCTSSRILADDIQELIQKCGRDATVLEKDMQRWANQLATRPAFQIVERYKNYQHLPKGQIVPYSGYVYCVTVPSGLLYVRRNGKPAWCGNSHGVTPKMYIETAETENWTPEQLGYYERTLNDQWSGQTQRRQQIMLGRPGMKPTQLKSADEAYGSAYDEYLILQMGAKFGIPQSLLGVAMKSSIGGGAAGKQQSDQSEQFATDAMKNWLVGIINDMARRFLGVGPELTMTSTGGGNDDDDLTRAQADEIDVNTGIRTRNEIRAERGIPLMNEPEADQLGVTIATGVSFLSGALEAQQTAAAMAAQPPAPPQTHTVTTAPDGTVTETHGTAPSAAGTHNGTSASVGATSASVGSTSASVAPKPTAKDDTPDVDAKDDPRQPDTDATKELAAFSKWARTHVGRASRNFEFQHVDTGLAKRLNDAARIGDLTVVKSLISDAKNASTVRVIDPYAHIPDDVKREQGRDAYPDVVIEKVTLDYDGRPRTIETTTPTRKLSREELLHLAAGWRP